MRALQKIALGICLFFSMLLLATKSTAQIKAAFTANKNTFSCSTERVYFSDNSTGSPTSWLWNFGDQSVSETASPNHQYTKPGRYTVSLIVKNVLQQADTAVTTVVVLGPTVQYTKTIDTTCSTVNIKFSSKATGLGPLTYSWDFGDGKTSTSLNSSVTHAYKGASNYLVSLVVKDTSGCSAKAGEALAFGCVAPVLSSAPNTLTASRECTDQFGWTNYYADNNTPANIKDDILLLSLRKNGNNIGKVADGTFQVKVAATEKAGTSQAILLNAPAISNPSGYYVMNRYWAVNPTTQPTSAVGVRFYFNNQDVADINGSYPSHDAEFQQLIFYKTKDGNPDPSTSLKGVTDINSIFPGSDADENNWTYTYIGAGSHAAEFTVTNLSGGGGGGITQNNQALPVKLISFTGKPESGGVKLNWTVASEVSLERYDVEASEDGKTFTPIGNVKARGSLTITSNYNFNDQKVKAKKVRYYKLVMVDKDGKKSSSEVIKIALADIGYGVSVYPVPANNYLTIVPKNIINKAVTAEVYNSLGLKVLHINKTASANTIQLNTSSLPNGRYRTIIFTNNEKIGEANFIIVR
ncbi:PKD domain-containing protein [Segetibacter sp.]|jgi:PKD repeat protein|uniref:T9SS type A sorting domain-containing protein n=1 Tax=Segetibacter sp. TaxID=2231182 RepID=UPI00262E485A|nr:PKD domain-containing protein [Segetibacter sp.]MCW3081866.1 cell surface protein [Segetibacter sp.]